MASVVQAVKQMKFDHIEILDFKKMDVTEIGGDARIICASRAGVRKSCA